MLASAVLVRQLLYRSFLCLACSPCRYCVGQYLALLLLGTIGAAEAQTVWSGLSFPFSNTGSAAANLPQNQDRITENVWITRNSFGMGLLNAATECDPDSGLCMYTHNSSPQGTRLGNGGMAANAGKTIAASNWQELTFTDWEDSYGKHRRRVAFSCQSTGTLSFTSSATTLTQRTTSISICGLPVGHSAPAASPTCGHRTVHRCRPRPAITTKTTSSTPPITFSGAKH